MLRSMYSGISGMKNFQTKLDVIGNNIANVNTFGFKKGRTTFKDMVSQQIAGATAPTELRGGANTRQIGLGSQVATIDTIHTQGSNQNTGRVLDLMISGDGYFVVATAKEDSDIWGIDETDTSGAEPGELNLNYTRAGNFYFDKNGYIVNSDGLYLIGKTIDIEAGSDDPGAVTLDDLDEEGGRIRIPTDAESFSIGADGIVNFIDSQGNLKIAGQIRLATFPNPEGLSKVGNNLYTVNANSGRVGNVPEGDDLEWEEHFNTPGIGGSGSLVASSLEMSNVDLSEEFTEMIVAQRGFQSNTKIITTSDEILQELINLKR